MKKGRRVLIKPHKDLAPSTKYISDNDTSSVFKLVILPLGTGLPFERDPLDGAVRYPLLRRPSGGGVCPQRRICFFGGTAPSYNMLPGVAS